MGPMQRVVNSYRSFNENELTRILSNENDRKVVELWLKSHQVLAADSPMLTDLQNRISQGQHSRYQESAIERIILSGKIDRLIEDFKREPKELPKHIDLIKTHVELKTITSKDVQNLLPLLLDHVSTKDIADILNQNDPITTFSSLSNIQLLRLCAIHTPEYQRNATHKFLRFVGAEPKLPQFAKEFIHILQKKEAHPNDLKDIKNLTGLTEKEKDAALAYYIERHDIPLESVKQVLNDDEFFLRLAPYMRYANFNGFENKPLAQKFVKNCPNLNELHISNGVILWGISELPCCQRLACNDCSNLTELPALPLCQNLSCANCPLSALPALPHCHELNCYDCPLRALPALPLCQKLYCFGSTNLTALPALPLCEELNCNSCTALSALPALPQCQKINCTYCSALPALPALPLCQELNCNVCTSLSALPALPLCRELQCGFCSALTSIGALPLCQKLECARSPALSALPALPQCRELTCYGCPLLTELPELPFNAHVVSTEEGYEGLPFTSLDIPIENFAKEPVTLLLELGNHLLNIQPFPNIYYFEKGQRNDAVDIGGLRRDFVTKLCLNLFNAKGLKQEDNIPLAASDNEEKAYRSLGCLLAQCYPPDSAYKTGPLFNPKVYQCLLKPNPTSDEWFLTNYLDFINASSEVKQLIDLSKPAPQLKNLSQIAYLVDPTGETPYHHSREELRQILLARAKQQPQLKAISWMAQEIRKRIPNLTGNLQEKIEGVLNPTALKRKLTWIFTKPNDRRFNKTKDYLTHWIDHHEDKLEKFVYAVTGTRTLAANDLKIEVFDRDKNFIPVAHTCFFSLELSANYENQKAFDQKIEYFLEYALAGSGFTMA